MSEQTFQDHIDFLRANLRNLVEYKERTGTLQAGLKQVNSALFDDDPFIVLGASLAATAAFSEDRIYH